MNKQRIFNISILTLTCALILILTLTLCVTFTRALADEPPEMNYMELMLQSVVDGNADIGQWAEQMRNDKIDALGLDYQKVSWNELNLLSQLIYWEAGSDGISQEWRRDVAAVALNRVDSPEFPNTLYEVVYQRGQYACASRIGYGSPTREHAEAALMALEGQDDLPPDVVFQANFSQGSGTFRTYYLYPYGTTYLSYSSCRWLYE